MVRFIGLVMLCVAQILLTVSLNYTIKKITPTISPTEQPIYLDVVCHWEWEDLPQAFKRWIVHQASVRAATQLVSNQELVQMLMMQEHQGNAACQQYETDQGDYSFFGWNPNDNVVYNSYQPYRTLMR